VLQETNDMKIELLKRTAKHRQQLEKEVELISERTQNVLTNALIIGGTLATGYLLVRLFTGSSKRKSKSSSAGLMPISVERQRVVEEEPSSPGIMSQIGSALASQATVFLLGLAKEKLAEYLQAPAEKNVKENEPS
jgi:hypothetical protein